MVFKNVFCALQSLGYATCAREILGLWLTKEHTMYPTLTKLSIYLSTLVSSMLHGKFCGEIMIDEYFITCEDLVASLWGSRSQVSSTLFPSRQSCDIY